MNKETSVLLVDPVAKTVTDGGMADGYAGIKTIFEERFPGATQEHNTLSPSCPRWLLVKEKVLRRFVSSKPTKSSSRS